MVNVNVIERLDNLIKLGEKVLETSGYYSDNEGLFQQWYTSCRALLNMFPPEYIYASDFKNACDENELEHVERGVAILRAAKGDIESGVLHEWSDIISAEIFDDFLEMAEYLLANGYKDPTASLIGAVLENELRRMCRDNTITVKNDDNIASLNQKLFQKPVYGKPQMKQISIWQSIRDSADHGKFEEYNAESVKNMLEGVRNFLTSQLS